MAKLHKQLTLKIEQSGKVIYRRLTNRDKLSIGRRPDNDITIYGNHYPKKHILISRENNHFQLHLQKYMKGGVRVGQSRLTFEDMIIHNLLPLKGDSFYYPLTHDKKGFLIVGDAKISFRFDDPQSKTFEKFEVPKFKGYSWLYVTIKQMGRDIPFKTIVLSVAIIHALMLNYMSKNFKGFVPKVNVTKVPERFAKFIIKKPSVTKPEKNTLSSGVRKAEEEAEEEAKAESAEANKQKPKQAEKSRGKEVRPESQGILGLLSGTASTGQSSSMIDLLIDKGLVRDLDQVMTNSKLTIGKGTPSGTDFDELIALSEIGGGIDDILTDIDEVETVSFSEKRQVEIDRIGEMKGTANALGQRSEESVRAVMLSYTGRLTYIYEKYLKQNPNLNGKLVVEVEIAPSGLVANVTAISSTLNNREFELEILDVIRRWTYEPIDAGKVTVTYPLIFNKTE